jgi:haloacid dehalogenase superfamily, subfamily IA, variant 3 with third motif having DD or ED/haloacid dehalogenase superfamily, subfamily IA, variant 1 with third motif having Dx(3-4)D or Dx(3-4)E
MKAVLFDMDGVLVDSEPFIAEAAIAMLAEAHGVVASREDFLPFVGMGEDRFIGGVAEKHGVKLDPERDKARTYELYFEVIRGRLREIPGAVAFVEACRGLGLKTAIVTSADRRKLEANLREIGLDESRFEVSIDGLQIGRKKPYPDIYLEAARRLGVEPGDCLVVEDAVAGVKAAKAAGMTCLALGGSFSEAELRSAGADAFACDFVGISIENIIKSL